MSTTTSSRPRRTLRFLLAGAFVLVAWFALLAVATVLLEPSRRVVVFASPADAIRALVRGDALILGGGNGFTIMHGRKTGFVWLPRPDDGSGCRRRTRALSRQAAPAIRPVSQPIRARLRVRPQ